MHFHVTSDFGSPSHVKESYNYFPRSSDAHSKAYSDAEIQGKIQYIQHLITNITTAKETFMENINDAHKDIENIMRNLFGSVCVREQELKAQLEVLRGEKVTEWDRQIRLCQQGEENLKNINENFFELVEVVKETFNKFAQDIGFIESGKMIFSTNSEDVVKELENLGSVSMVDEEKPPEKLHPKFVIEGKDKILGRFWQPWGVCTDATGRILVTDFGNDMIQVFNEYGRFLFHFGKSGTGPGEFNRPSGIAVDSKCRIIVSDKDNHRVQIFTFTGNFLTNFGQKGTRPGEFQYPSDVAVNQKCDVAVCDKRNHRIQLFNLRGSFVTHFDFSKNISDPNPRVCPRRLTFQPDGSLLVTDSSSQYIFLIDKNFSVVTKIGENSCLKSPQGIACNRQGVFAVTDGKCNRVQIFDINGGLLKSLEVGKANPECGSCLHGICFCPNGGFIIADFGNHRILVF